MDLLSRALFVALVGLLASAFFGSRQFSKQLWLLLALAPAFLALARAGAVQARERLAAPRSSDRDHARRTRLQSPNVTARNATSAPA